MKALPVLLGLAAAAGAQAPLPANLTPAQAAEDYDYCIRGEAMTLSRSETAPEAVFAAAKSACAPRRAALLAGHEADAGWKSALDEIDARRAASLPDGIRRVRERQHAVDAASGGQKSGS